MNDEHKIHDRLPSGFDYADQIQSATYAEKGYVPGAAKLCHVRATADEVEHETNLLQGQGPDEFPRGYYEHLAVENTKWLAVRLAPPKVNSTLMRRAIIVKAFQEGDGPTDILPWYIAQYNAGFAAGKRSGGSAAFDSGATSHAWDDGYLDAAAGRPKWHLTHCIDHDACGEG